MGGKLRIVSRMGRPHPPMGLLPIRSASQRLFLDILRIPFRARGYKGEYRDPCARGAAWLPRGGERNVVWWESAEDQRTGTNDPGEERGDRGGHHPGRGVRPQGCG